MGTVDRSVEAARLDDIAAAAVMEAGYPAGRRLWDAPRDVVAKAYRLAANALGYDCIGDWMNS